MRTRTRLTTPPGEEPAPPPSSVPEQDGEAAGERYVPAFAVPEEPRPPSRYRKAVIVVLVLAVLAVAAWGVLQVVTAGEDFDPAVGENPGAPAEPLPDEGADGTATTGTDGG